MFPATGGPRCRRLCPGNVGRSQKHGPHTSTFLQAELPLSLKPRYDFPREPWGPGALWRPAGSECHLEGCYRRRPARSFGIALHAFPNGTHLVATSIHVDPVFQQKDCGQASSSPASVDSSRVGPQVPTQFTSKTCHSVMGKEWKVEYGVCSQRQVQAHDSMASKVRKGLRVDWDRTRKDVSGDKNVPYPFRSMHLSKFLHHHQRPVRFTECKSHSPCQRGRLKPSPSPAL